MADDNEDSFGERLLVIEEELGQHTERLRVKAKKYESDALTETDPVMKRVLEMGNDIVMELVDTSLDFQTEVVGIVREAIEDDMGDELIGIEGAHADTIMKPLVNFKAALTEWIAAQQDPTLKAHLTRQLAECEEAIKLVNELVLPDGKEDADEDKKEGDEAPN